MVKTILITGSTDGIGLKTAQMLYEQGHKILLHGRNRQKLYDVQQEFSDTKRVKSYCFDLSETLSVLEFAETILESQEKIDVLINNAGVFKTPNRHNADGMEMRFMVNCFAPYMLTMLWKNLLEQDGRVINLSSAAQNQLDLSTIIKGAVRVDDMHDYAQSKTALTLWGYTLAHENLENFPAIFSVNPGSLLASKMVHEGFGVEGHDLRIGAKILFEAALSPQFEGHSGEYYDNDIQKFTNPHPDAENIELGRALIALMNGEMKGL